MRQRTKSRYCVASDGSDIEQRFNTTSQSGNIVHDQITAAAIDDIGLGQSRNLACHGLSAGGNAAGDLCMGWRMKDHRAIVRYPCLKGQSQKLSLNARADRQGTNRDDPIGHFADQRREPPYKDGGRVWISLQNAPQTF